MASQYRSQQRRRYLMCRPDHLTVSYEINPCMHPAHAIDTSKPVRQWQALHNTYLGLGHEVELIDPILGLNISSTRSTAEAGPMTRWLGEQVPHPTGWNPDRRRGPADTHHRERILRGASGRGGPHRGRTGTPTVDSDNLNRCLHGHPDMLDLGHRRIGSWQAVRTSSHLDYWRRGIARLLRRQASRSSWRGKRL